MLRKIYFFAVHESLACFFSQKASTPTKTQFWFHDLPSPKSGQTTSNFQKMSKQPNKKTENRFFDTKDCSFFGPKRFSVFLTKKIAHFLAQEFFGKGPNPFFLDLVRCVMRRNGLLAQLVRAHP